MGITVESLELEVQSSSNEAALSISNLTNTLGKLKNATKGLGLGGVSKQLTTLNTALNGVSDGNTDKLNKLAQGLKTLSSCGSIKLSPSIATQITRIGSAVQSISGTDFGSLNSLANALTPLSNIGKSNLSSFVTQLEKLPKASQALNSINMEGVSRQISQLAAALTPLTQMGKNNLTSFVTQLQKLPQVMSALQSVDMSTLASQIQQLANALAPLATQMQSIANGFAVFPARIQRLISSTNRLTTANGKASLSYINLWAKARMAYNAIKAGARAISSWITESNDYIENLNLFNASMGEYAAEAQKYAEQVGELMGIDPGEWMRNQGIFNTIISGFGVASDKAYLMSKNLTQLGYDISSFFNISFEDAMQKLQSGISGELEPLRRLGYDLSVARLQQEALNLGIEKSVNNMTQAEKSQLRYYAIMTQVTVAQGDMARTLEAPKNQLRVLQAQVTQCARALGNVFIPVLNAVLPYAIALAKVLRMVASAIASFFGFTLPEVDYSGLAAGSSAVGDLADNAGDASDGLGKAAKAAKKLKNATLGIDELNIISPNDDSASGSGSGGAGIGGAGIGGGAGDLGIDLPTYDFLGDLVSTRVDKIVEMIKGAMSEITAVISGFLLAIGTILVVTGANIPLGLGLMAVGAVGLAATIAENWNGMSERLAKTLTLITGILGGFLLAIGAFLVFSGVNVPLGAGLMVAGAVSLATAATINWKFLNGDLSNALSILTGIVSGALLAMGALFAFTGVSVPLGIALMAAGAIGLATAVGLNWDSMSDPMRKAIGTLEAIVGGALLTFGAILALTGVNIPLGIGMIAAGAVSLVSAVALNWDSITGDLKGSISTITSIVSGALIGIGAILALTGVATPLGIAMIAAGAIGIVATASLNWKSLTQKVSGVLKEIGIAVGAALIAVGAILALSGVALPLGIALIAAGAVSLAAGVSLNWDSITKKVKEVLGKIGDIGGSLAMIGIGLLLALTGVATPVGIALLAKGVGSLVTGKPISWDSLVGEVKGGLDKIATKFGEFKDTVGKKLEGAKTTITTWAGNVKEYFTKGADGKNAIDNIKEAAGEWGESFKEGLSEKFSNAKSWVKTNITTPLSKAIEKSPVGELAVKIKNTSSEWWSNAQEWWADKTKDGVTLEAFVDLVKKKWSTVKKWIGDIPTIQQAVALGKEKWDSVKSWIGDIPVVKQGVALAKEKWSTVKDWIGNIPTLSQFIKLAKEKWDSVKNWIGNIPTLSQYIQLLKEKWTTVKGWIGNIPVLSQYIQLLKEKWTTVKNWIGNIPVLSQAISLLKSGWSKVSDWVKLYMGGAVSKGISLAKSGWSSVSNWVSKQIGGAVSVTVNLVSKWKGKIKKFFGLSSGGIVTAGGGIQLFEKGGFIDNGVAQFWKNIPMYANGTTNAGLHGTMFVAGENGAEMVGHINGQTEVLNRSQIAMAMKSAVVSGMAQFTGYWRNMNSQMAVCANAVIRSILVSSDVMTASLAMADGYDPTNSLAQSVYEDSQRAYNRSSYDDESISRSMRDFYREYVEPSINRMVTATERQADKEEQTIVQIGNRHITDAVETQKKANGYSFTR